MSLNIKKVVIIGAGTMGQGMAQWFAQCAETSTIESVELVDINQDLCKDAIKRIIQSWNKLESKGKFTKEQIAKFEDILNPIAMEDISEDSDLVIEAIVENKDIKCKVFQSLDEKLKPGAILASNTSSIPIDSMALSLSKERKKRFLGIHFFNPATIMKLVEIINGSETDLDLCQELKSWFDSQGKKPALCKDSPGFIVNRVARNFYGESLRIANIDSQEKYREIDSVLKEVGGFRMGPFELMDLIGIDVNYSVTESVWNSFYQEPRFAPHSLQRKMVESGRHGRKSAKGFYSYED
ncbi:MAG: 3-hydroxybutyryl-CoA dehydrogenase [Oligoflexia bacterium]|nr:3-hydroxybutyryl-CoA dehydrogenase [Oligoflexia bacterium]